MVCWAFSGLSQKFGSPIWSLSCARARFSLPATSKRVPRKWSDGSKPHRCGGGGRCSWQSFLKSETNASSRVFSIPRPCPARQFDIADRRPGRCRSVARRHRMATFLAYALLYRARNEPLLAPDRLHLLVLAPRLTKPYREELRSLGVTPHQEKPGIWALAGGAGDSSHVAAGDWRTRRTGASAANAV